jgi:hypothetical protein
MTVDALVGVVAREPFKPFVVVLEDGERIAIRRPLRALVTQDHLLLGVEEDEKTGLSSRMRRLAISDVKMIEDQR